jgi:uncharacterized protein YndB with AHSA1/START domain
MQPTASPLVRVSDTEIRITREFNAPPELVFRAWTVPEYVQQWWSPHPWTIPVCTIDLRPGGEWLYCMQGPDGTRSWGKSTYRQVIPNELLEFEDAFVDENGTPLEGMPTGIMRVEFQNVGGRTRLVSTTTYPSAEQLDQVLAMGMAEGLGMGMDQLDALLQRLRA